ncbi:MAG TPA: PQQ-binding-like beta-propeller repeat protein [Tepidisphaeraceae bacterium]|nr:PQQ-binding-like beta-propeller repeat protein [Tepidisphaeraceae bacterium]
MPYDGSSEGSDKSVGWKKPWDKAVILAVDKKTGQVKWQGKRGLSRIAHVTPSVMQVNGKAQLISAAGDVVQGHDLESGELIWTIYGQGEGVVPSVVLGDGLVYYCTGFEKSMIRAVRPDGKGDVSKTHVVWEQTANVPTMSSCVLGKGYLFAIKENGMAMCLNAKTGQIVWQRRIGGNHSASPIYADGKIWFLSEEGDATIIEAGPEYKPVAKNSLGEKCQASHTSFSPQSASTSAEKLPCPTKSSRSCDPGRSHGTTRPDPAPSSRKPDPPTRLAKTTLARGSASSTSHSPPRSTASAAPFLLKRPVPQARETLANPPPAQYQRSSSCTGPSAPKQSREKSFLTSKNPIPTPKQSLP